MLVVDLTVLVGGAVVLLLLTGVLVDLGGVVLAVLVDFAVLVGLAVDVGGGAAPAMSPKKIPAAVETEV